MEQWKLPPIRSSLLNYAISKLTPHAFSHPVWIRFGRESVSASRSAIADLFSAAKSLQANEPGTACQILLLCAIYQNQAGYWFNALKTTQEALLLARSSSLANETIWALWGTCAILIQQEKREQACEPLVDLQASLSEQNEWVLANFVAVFRQALSQPGLTLTGRHSQSLNAEPIEDTLAITFDWLKHWGFTVQVPKPQFNAESTQQMGHAVQRPAVAQSFLEFQPWKTLLMTLRGQLGFRLKKSQSPGTDNRSSAWRSILGSVHHFKASRMGRMQASDVLPAIDSSESSLVSRENLSPTPVTDRIRPATPSKVKQETGSDQDIPLIPMAVHMLGSFSMTIGDLAIKIPASRSLSILKYLLVHRRQHTSREVLMDIFWPNVAPETARNNLNVAMHSLRKLLRSAIFLPVILYQEGGYVFDPNLQIWLDIEEFARCVQEGQRLEARNQISAARTEYEAAISLYQGDFLEQNPYEEWTILDRERLRITYLDTLDRLSQIYFNQEQYAACIAVCQLILTYDHCREDAHCILMRCYSRQGQLHLALRQYQICVELLRSELDIEPALQTRKLCEQILKGNS